MARGKKNWRSFAQFAPIVESMQDPQITTNGNGESTNVLTSLSTSVVGAEESNTVDEVIGVSSQTPVTASIGIDVPTPKKRHRAQMDDSSVNSEGVVDKGKISKKSEDKEFSISAKHPSAMIAPIVVQTAYTMDVVNAVNNDMVCKLQTFVKNCRNCNQKVDFNKLFSERGWDAIETYTQLSREVIVGGSDEFTDEWIRQLGLKLAGKTANSKYTDVLQDKGLWIKNPSDLVKEICEWIIGIRTALRNCNRTTVNDDTITKWIKNNLIHINKKQTQSIQHAIFQHLEALEKVHSSCFLDIRDFCKVITSFAETLYDQFDAVKKAGMLKDDVLREAQHHPSQNPVEGENKGK